MNIIMWLLLTQLTHGFQSQNNGKVKVYFEVDVNIMHLKIGHGHKEKLNMIIITLKMNRRHISFLIFASGPKCLQN